MSFGSAFRTAWSGVTSVTKIAAAGIATGAKVVGEIPVMAAKAAAATLETGQKLEQSLERGIVKGVGAAAVGVEQWSAWMDTEAAKAVAAVRTGAASLMGDDTAAVAARGRADVERIQADGRRQVAGMRGLVRAGESMVESSQAKDRSWLQAKDAGMIAGARQMQSGIAKAGGAVGGLLQQGVEAAGRVGQGVADQMDQTATALLGHGFAGALTLKDLYGKTTDFFSGKEAGAPSQPCPLALARSLERRDALVADAIKKAAELPPGKQKALREAAAKLEKDNQVADSAAFSADVYKDFKDSGPWPPGWKRLSDDDLIAKGLDPESFHPKGSKFRAALYENEQGQYQLAFKGTTFTSGDDWTENIRQGLGVKSDYYARAKDLALETKLATDGNLRITGHSLGGGLASEAALAAGVPATTFNPAGLNPNTIAGACDPKDYVQRQGQIERYVVQGEVLNNLQDNSLGALPKSIGNRTDLPPFDANGNSAADLGTVDKHGMEIVQGSLEHEQQADEKALEELMAGK